jgi:hypothetical protein
VHIPPRSKAAVADFDRFNWLAEASGARWGSVLSHCPIAIDPRRQAGGEERP